MINNYKKLQVWEKSISLVKDIYLETKDFPEDEKFGLMSQMRRCAVSIPSNIAEGRLRGSDAEFKRFLFIAFASGGELETQLQISLALGFVKKPSFDKIYSELSEIMKMLNVLINKLDASC